MATAPLGGDRLGETLLREGVLSREQLAQAIAEQKSSKHRLGYVLAKLGLVPELEITKILARQYRMPAVDLSRFDVDPKILKLVPADMAAKGVVLPLKREGRTLTVAMADPTDLGLLEDLKFITRFDLFPVLAGEYTLRMLIEKHYNDQQVAEPPQDMEASGAKSRSSRQKWPQAQIEDAPVVKLINRMLIDAVKRGASYTHRAVRHEIRVRYRSTAPAQIMRRRSR
jgi:type IV pilus assembly protein PilB